ncbi:MAG: DUF4080 domain-containing protein [Nitrospinaceae bacterium]
MELSIGLITLNAKYIHSSLSLRYLRNAARRAGYKNVWIREYVINQPTWQIAAEIRKCRPDVLGLSVYIWNRAQSFELIERLKKHDPSLGIVLGGPEISFEPGLSEDYTLISGEGENKWVEYLNYRRRGETPPAPVLNRWNTYGEDAPDLLPPYIEEDYPDLRDRIVYFETSRGCPYLCSFCLSALDKTVRYFEEESVNRQIGQLVRAGVKRIKFVDRTFNLKPQRMRELMRRLSRFQGVSFHFEVVAELLSPDLLAFLATVPEGMFQFEIGIQTTSGDTQSLIQRRQNNEKLFGTLRELVRQNRIHFHCDLIFGLPGETLEDNLKSFEEVMALKPHELQLGFLKFLPGAPIRSLIEDHRYEFQSTPPYEVISHKDLSADDILYLKKFCEVFDLFYNSKRFRFSIDRLLGSWGAVDLFHYLLEYMERRNLLFRSHSLEDQYRIFFDAFSLETQPAGADLLKLDYLYAQRTYHLPRFMRTLAPPHHPSGTKTWPGDGKTLMVPFRHEILFHNGDVSLKPSSGPCYYAIVHPRENSGYLRQPAITRVLD